MRSKVEKLLDGDLHPQARKYVEWSIELETALQNARKERKRLSNRYHVYALRHAQGRPVRSYISRREADAVLINKLERELREKKALIFVLGEHRKAIEKLTREYVLRRDSGFYFPLILQVTLSPDVFRQAALMLGE